MSTKESIVSSGNNSQVSQLKLSELHKLDDGLLEASLAANLKTVIADLHERPNDDRPRKVKIEFSLTPEAVRGELDRIHLGYKVANTVASHDGRECILTPRRIGKEDVLVFANLGTDARQPHLDLGEDE